MIAALLLFISATASSSVRDLSIDYNAFLDGSRFLELPGQQVKERLALNLAIDILGPFYFDGMVHALSTPYHYSWVGLKFDLGVHLFSDQIDIYYRHHSQHALDVNYSPFPVEDAFGFRWRIIK